MDGRNAGVVATASTEGRIVFQNLSRRQLQRLSKKHGIPANKSSTFLAECLGKVLQNGTPSPLEIPGPGFHKCTTSLQHSVKPTASPFPIALKLEDFQAPNCAVSSFTIQTRAQKLRLRNAHGGSKAGNVCKLEPACEPGDSVTGPHPEKKPQASDVTKVKQEQEAELRPSIGGDPRELVEKYFHDLDDPFARIEPFTPSLEALFAWEDEGIEVNQALPVSVHQDASGLGAEDGANRQSNAVQGAHGGAKKPCSPGDMAGEKVGAVFLEKGVFQKQETSEAEVAVGTQPESSIETVEPNFGAKETSMLEKAKPEASDRCITSAQTSDVTEISEKDLRRGSSGRKTSGEKMLSAGMEIVEQSGTRAGSKSHLRGTKRSFVASGVASGVPLEPPKVVPIPSTGYPMESVAPPLNFEYCVEKPDGISLIVDLNEKCSPGAEFLQYFHRLEAMTCTAPVLKRPAPKQSPTRVTRICSILNLAAAKGAIQ